MGKFGEINSADTRAGKFPLVPIGGWAEGPACADLVRAKCVRQRNEVAIKLGIISLSPPLPAVCSKPEKGVS